MYSTYYETAVQSTAWVDDILTSIDGARAGKATVQHEIIHTPEGVILSIWEPAVVTQSRIYPYLYRVNYRLDSEAMAQALLKELLPQLVA